MKNKYIIISLLVALVIVIGYIAYTTIQQDKKDKIAKCLTDNKVVMYGASWCSHCAEERKEFGTSFKYINYVNCSDNPDKKDQVCVDKKILKYPTWIMNDDKRLEGVYFPETLGREFGCSY